MLEASSLHYHKSSNLHFTAFTQFCNNPITLINVLIFRWIDYDLLIFYFFFNQPRHSICRHEWMPGYRKNKFNSFNICEKKIRMMADGCGSQNKNSTMLSLCCISVHSDLFFPLKSVCESKSKTVDAIPFDDLAWTFSVHVYMRTFSFGNLIVLVPITIVKLYCLLYVYKIEKRTSS